MSVDAGAASTSRAGEAWPALPDVLREHAIGADDPRYDRVRSNYMRVGSPRLVVMAQTEAEVAETIRYAAGVRAATGQTVPFSFRSGGHGMTTSSVNDGGIIVDISAMNRIELLDPDTGMVRVQAGAKWGEVAQVLTPHGLVITSGNYGDTGVGGLATSGGVGFFVRSHGLTIDRVRGARLITADGTPRWVDADHEPELFWGVRGGGSQLGIVTDLLFQAVRVGTVDGEASVINQMVHYLTPDLPGFVTSWGDWINDAPREMTSFLMLQHAGEGRTAVQAINVWEGTNTVKAAPVIESAATLAPVLGHQAAVLPYPRVMLTPREPHRGQQRIRLRNVLVDHLDADLGAALEESLAHRTTGMGELRSVGGAVADVPADATAWTGRHQPALAATWVHQHPTSAQDESFAPLQRLGTGTYGAYSSDTRPCAAELAWPGRTGRRLRRLAERVDPDRLFDQGLHLRHEHRAGGHPAPPENSSSLTPDP